MDDDRSPNQPWLLLIHQLPSKPAYLRVKVWRRLQAIGAVAVKSTVYALPATAETREDFAWLLKEIVEGGGEALVCEARLIDGLSDDQARALFDTARDADYEAIATEVRALAETFDAAAGGEEKTDARAHARRLRKRLADVIVIDFFGATGRLGAEGAIAELESRLVADNDMDAAEPEAARTDDLKGRIWVTRKGVHIDRIACSWLIRRFIDPDAVIRFVPGKGYVPKPGELRFDMFEAEFTHEGEACTFEVLLKRAGLDDPALTAIAEIVHDIDLKDGKYGRAETAGVARMLAGIAAPGNDDPQRLAKGADLLDGLYQSFRSKS